MNLIQGERIGKTGVIAVGCTAAIFDPGQQKLLLTQRSDNGRWCLPGGHMEPGESVEEACSCLRSPDCNLRTIDLEVRTNNMPKHPLTEVFGFPTNTMTSDAERYRKNRLCPFNNKVPSCTKDKAENPLGVCSIYEGNKIAITCPIRFRQDWLIAEDAASFFFSSGSLWTSLTEVRINDKHGRSAGNIDVVLVSYDHNGKILDFGSLEVQAVYISGNVRKAFEYYMENPEAHADMDWTKQRNYPRPDYLSSSRK